ncbi:MAG: YlmC/YmxH family sporulation protein [Clostridia bacterium]|jgi:YlmC/YmxH family sporulation protein|nr:YlmC/YmxH family sporulation protein [Clostridia bacterium]MCI2013828.1 YlmC/YmxH family sporulation protein [Clostridia bacterium]
MDCCGRIEKLSCFRKKDVVNISDGSKLGFVCDMEFDDVSGKIFTIIVSNGRNLCSLFCENQCFVIPWNKIVRVGDDIILVDVCVEKLSHDC